MNQQDRWMPVSNTSWAYATADQLWAGEEHNTLTPYEYYEMMDWAQVCRDMTNAERRYGDCGRSIVGTGDYEQMLAEEAREAHGLPAYPYAYNS